MVIDRHVTRGTRDPAGRAWCERIWTVLATCAQQGRPVFDYLVDSLDAAFTQHPAPSRPSYPNPTDFDNAMPVNRYGWRSMDDPLAVSLALPVSAHA